jgi:hypothetical protein
MTTYYATHPAVVTMLRSFACMFHMDAEIQLGDAQPSGDPEVIKSLSQIEKDWAPDWIAHDAKNPTRKFNRRPHLNPEAALALDEYIRRNGGSASEIVSKAVLDCLRKEIT